MTQTATWTPIRLIATLFALATWAFLFAEPASAQFEREWEKSNANGNLAGYISSDGSYAARGLAYGEVDDGNGNTVERVFVASNWDSDTDQAGDYRIYVVDPSTGDELGRLTWNQSEIEKGGYRFLNDVGVSEDGVIIACNATNDPSSANFYCYRWDSLTDDPTIVVNVGDNTLGTGTIGPHISVTGSASQGNLQIHLAAGGAQTIYQLTGSFNSTGDYSVTELSTAESSTPDIEDAYPDPDGGYYHTTINEPAKQYDGSESEVGQIPAGVADSLVSLNIFEVNGEKFLAGAKNDYAGDAGANDRARLANITDGADNATMYGETPSLGSTTQFQGNGDVDVRVNDDGTVTLFYLATNNGIAAFTADEGPFGTEAPITIDGDLTDSEYNALDNADGENGFGGGASVRNLRWYVDDVNENLYVAVAGSLGTDVVFGDLNNIGIWVNVTGGNSAPSGLPAGDTLGLKIDEDHRYLTGNFASADDPDANTNFTADFEVDFMTAVGPTFANPGSDAIAVIGNHTTDPSSIVPFDTTDQMGTSAMDQEGLGIEYAFMNKDTDTTGVEWKIPFDAIGATSNNSIEVFAFAVSSTAFFSNEVVPGDASGVGNAGTDAQWDMIADSTGQTFHTSPIALPVELASFSAQRDGKSAVLSWKTASETGNAGFAVQHAVGPEGAFQQVGWVEGAGTTTEARTYRYAVEDLSAGTHRFRLRQEDLDGSASLSKVVTVEVRPEGPIAIEQVAPNPVTQTGTLRFTARESGSVSVGLYDVLGRKVRTLHEGRVSGGQSQRVRLDATGLSSGVYFLRVKGEGFSKTQRLTVVK